MKNKQFPKPALYCLVLGLLVISATQVLSRYLNMPDFVHGCLMGLGLGVEWFAFILVARTKRKSLY
ncbi:MAG: hypothetical protein ABIN91_14255 [Mucilaginibacter sp.]|uniref:hypothetical protein n=1 Tax=Mucilaginibacter sp. TaxID=1882438 RepID=UPI0032650F05